MTATPETLARRTAVVLIALAAPVALAGPASADVPEGWSPNPENVSPLHALLVLGGIPVLLFLLIVLAIYVPAVIRGESVTPGGHDVEDQWFGGPRKGTAELAGPDTDASKAGGASGRW